MPHQQLTRQFLCVTLLLTFVWQSKSDVLIESNFDDLPIGTAPDNETDAGPWRLAYPASLAIDKRETHPNMFSIVSTESFDANTPGNSLRIEQSGDGTSAAAYYFDEIVFDDDVDLVRADFDIYIPTLADGGRSGPSIMLGGSDEPFLAHTRRGPHIKWDSQGRLVSTTDYSPSGDRVFVSETPLDEWQRVRLDIDLKDNSYDVFWAVADDEFELVNPSEQFQIQGHLDFLDRIEIVSFSSRFTGGVGFIDNVRVEALTNLPGDANRDGQVNFADFLPLSNNFGQRGGWSEGDFDHNRRIQFADFLILSDNFGSTPPAAATVPEPNGFFALSACAVLGLLRFRSQRDNCGASGKSTQLLFPDASTQRWDHFSSLHIFLVPFLIALPTACLAQIERVDAITDIDGKIVLVNGGVIPGTEAIEISPGVDLSGWNSDERNLRFADFIADFRGEELDLTGAKFSDSWLEHAAFGRQNLLDEPPAFPPTNLSNADFSNSVLTGASFVNANLTNANLTGADLTNAKLGARLAGANLTNAIIKGAQFYVPDMGWIDSASSTGFTAEQLYSTRSYREQDLRDTTYSGDLSGWNFAGQNLSNAAFSWYTDLSDSDFSGANLNGARFQFEIDFSGANLSRADLTDCRCLPCPNDLRQLRRR